jgi:hypothetical protein
LDLDNEGDDEKEKVEALEVVLSDFVNAATELTLDILDGRIKKSESVGGIAGGEKYIKDVSGSKLQASFLIYL